MKTAIITDSTFYMQEKFIKENNVGRVAISVNFDDYTYYEENDNKIICEEILTRVSKEKKIPKTSQPSPQQFIDEFNNYVNQGFDHLIVLTISSRLSGTYQGAISAANMYKEDNPNIVIDIFDTEFAGQASSIMAQSIVKYNNIHGNIIKEEVEEILGFYRKEMNLVMVIDNLDYLKYGGRVSISSATIGNILGIKPVLRMEDGTLIDIAKSRSGKKALNELSKMFIESKTENPDSEFIVDVAHTSNEKMAELLREKINPYLTEKDEIIDSVEIGPSFIIQLGPGTFGIAWTKKFNVNDKIKNDQ